MNKLRKQPYQMTAKQLVKAIGPTRRTKQQSGIEPWMITKQQQFEYLQLCNKHEKGYKIPGGISRATSDQQHRQIIKWAIKQGKEIPYRVLLDYLDLMLVIKKLVVME